MQVDAICVDNGGGTKILLNYLIAELGKTDKHIYYLMDAQIKNNVQRIKPTNVPKLQKSVFLTQGFLLIYLSLS